MRLLEIAFLLVLAIVPFILWRSMKADDRKADERERMFDLEYALGSDDYRDLDAFLILYEGKLDKATIAKVQARRDDLYLEANHGNEV